MSNLCNFITNFKKKKTKLTAGKKIMNAKIFSFIYQNSIKQSIISVISIHLL